MPDVHLAENVCVGTVVATDDCLYPQAVGGDIGCGMAAVRLQADASALREESHAKRVFAGLREQVPAVRQFRPQEVTLGELSSPVLQRAVQRDAGAADLRRAGQRLRGGLAVGLVGPGLVAGF